MALPANGSKMYFSFICYQRGVPPLLKEQHWVHINRFMRIWWLQLHDNAFNLHNFSIFTSIRFENCQTFWFYLTVARTGCYTYALVHIGKSVRSRIFRIKLNLVTQPLMLLCMWHMQWNPWPFGISYVKEIWKVLKQKSVNFTKQLNKPP